ncbi:MAG: hypothetical protein CMO55_09165 [Verrucomicrobiales bacterium]|nr:hypothetical protein [Verrucomicrobiales bacterium]
MANSRDGRTGTPCFPRYSFTEKMSVDRTSIFSLRRAQSAERLILHIVFVPLANDGGVIFVRAMPNDTWRTSPDRSEPKCFFRSANYSTINTRSPSGLSALERSDRKIGLSLGGESVYAMA